ncbi:hypothetical protein L6Q96_13430 [Candidatus Binatia bacterium]|nr:hypothetical protein [Candidatus Binatia bacterium]
MGASDGRIDLMQDFTRLYQREEMLAFFDFRIAPPGREAIGGLCRISRPKDAASKVRYLSLTFVVDTPDEAARQAAMTALDRIAPAPLRQTLPEIREVLPVPSLSGSDESLVTQIDLLVHTDPARAFIAGQLVPVIGRLAGLEITDFVWWEAPKAPPTSPPKAAAPTSARAAAADVSLVGRLRRFLRDQLGIN